MEILYGKAIRKLREFINKSRGTTEGEEEAKRFLENIARRAMSIDIQDAESINHRRVLAEEIEKFSKNMFSKITKIDSWHIKQNVEYVTWINKKYRLNKKGRKKHSRTKRGFLRRTRSECWK